MRASELRIARAAWLFALLAPIGGCSENDAAVRARADAVALKRTIANLRELVSAAEQKKLVSTRWLAISLEEDAFRRVLSAGLPHETLVGGRVQVRIEHAAVRFNGGLPTVSLHARVSDVQSKSLFAQVAFQGGLDRIEVSPDGKLSTHVAVDRLEGVDSAEGSAEQPLPRYVVDVIGARGLDWLREVLPPVEIPVRLDQAIVINGLTQGPVQVGAGALPVHLQVARVLALTGRLWVLFDVSVGPWSAKPLADPARPGEGDKK